MIVVVPDGKHLKLTYTAKLNLRTYADETKNEHLTDENSYNEFSLSGFSSDQTKDRKSYNQVAYTPKHQTVSETGSVTIKNSGRITVHIPHWLAPSLRLSRFPMILLPVNGGWYCHKGQYRSGCGRYH